MHIPENYLSPSTCAVMTAAMVPAWGYSINKVRKEIPKAKMPLLGIGAAFSFLGMMFNVTTSGRYYRACSRRNAYCNSHRKSVSRMYISIYCVVDTGTAFW